MVLSWDTLRAILLFKTNCWCKHIVHSLPFLPKKAMNTSFALLPLPPVCCLEKVFSGTCQPVECSGDVLSPSCRLVFFSIAKTWGSVVIVKWGLNSKLWSVVPSCSVEERTELQLPVMLHQLFTRTRQEQGHSHAPELKAWRAPFYITALVFSPLPECDHLRFN